MKLHGHLISFFLQWKGSVTPKITPHNLQPSYFVSRLWCWYSDKGLEGDGVRLERMDLKTIILSNSLPASPLLTALYTAHFLPYLRRHKWEGFSPLLAFQPKPTSCFPVLKVSFEFSLQLGCLKTRPQQAVSESIWYLSSSVCLWSLSCLPTSLFLTLFPLPPCFSLLCTHAGRTGHLFHWPTWLMAIKRENWGSLPQPLFGENGSLSV